MRPISELLLVAALGTLTIPNVDAQQVETAVAPGLEVVASTSVSVGQRIVFRSKILDSEVSMHLWPPESFEHSSDAHTYPVVVVNGYHGSQFFPTLVGLVRHLGMVERMPESIVVSLDDMGEIPEVHTNGMWSKRARLGGSGDPRRSLRHLEQEVFPYLEEHYRANDFRLIIGVSGSAPFPIYTFTAAPHLFDSHILIAAADMVGMGYQPGKTFLDAFEDSFNEHPGRTARLYVAVADSDVEKRDDYRANIEHLAARLGAIEGLDLKVEVLPRTERYEAFLRGVISALDQSFPKERWSARYRDLVAQPGDALANIDAYYAELSKDYGFTILPRADRWNSVNSLRYMIGHLCDLGRTKEAIAVAERRIEYRPRVARSYAGLADALEADGQLGAAVGAQKKAIALASDKEREDLTERLRSLEAMREQADKEEGQ